MIKNKVIYAPSSSPSNHLQVERMSSLWLKKVKTYIKEKMDVGRDDSLKKEIVVEKYVMVMCMVQSMEKLKKID